MTGGSNVTASTTTDGEVHGLSLTLGHTSHSGSSSTGSATGTVVTGLSLNNGHVNSLTTYNLDNRYYTQSTVETKLDQLYGGSGWHDSRKIYIQSGTPTPGAAGNPWFQT